MKAPADLLGDIFIRLLRTNKRAIEKIDRFE